MAGITFSHPEIGMLSLRLPPKEVDWTYNLNTSTTNTYAGQVVQILSVNFETLTIVGQFGKEGRDDYTRTTSALVRKQIANKNVFGKYGPGLAQMTEWFKEYFAIASQGVNGSDNYNEQPVTIIYQGASNIAVDTGKSESKWLVYPINFPSYKIANDNFAPEWRVEAQIYEAPSDISTEEIDAAIKRLSYDPLYQPGNKFSDPYPLGPNPIPKELQEAAKAAFEASKQRVDLFWEQLPALTETDILNLLKNGSSRPETNKNSSAPKVTQRGETDPFARGLIEGTTLNGRIP